MSVMSFYNNISSDHAGDMHVLGEISLAVPNNKIAYTTVLAPVIVTGVVDQKPYYFQITPNGFFCAVENKTDDINGSDPPYGLSCTCNRYFDSYSKYATYAVICSYN